MKPRHQVSRDAMELIKTFEGFRASAAKLADGRWTIGYGHTKTAREGVEISENDAEALLVYDLLDISAAVSTWTYTPLTQNQFDALVSFAFNVGLDNFRRSAVLLRINEGSMLQAAAALEDWRKADFEGERIVVDALVRRRAAEKALFLTPPGGWVPAPSPVVQPRLDLESKVAQSMRRPTHLIVPLDGPAAVAHEDTTAQSADDHPASATEAAADAVAARLQALMPEPPPEYVEPDAADELPWPDAVEGDAEGSPPSIDSMPAPLDAPAPDGELEIEGPVDFTETEAEPDLEASGPMDAETIAARPAETTDETPMFGSISAMVFGQAAAAPQSEATDEPPAPYAPNIASADVPRPTLYEEIPDLGGAFAVFDEPAAKPGNLALAPSIILGVAGIFLFGGGVYWGITTQSPYAWSACLLGILFSAVAVYYLLERLGGGAD